jgi:hypothetical protein
LQVGLSPEEPVELFRHSLKSSSHSRKEWLDFAMKGQKKTRRACVALF